MYQSTSLNRFRRLVLVAGIVAGVAVPAAGAVTRPPDVQDAATGTLTAQISPPDVQDAAAVLHGTVQGLTADGLRLQAIAQAYGEQQPAVPDVFERYASTHPYGSGLSETFSVSRPPDVADAALTARYSTPVQSTGDFNWGDWGIGIGSGLGLVLLCGAGLASSRHVRQRVRTA
jgi:hypothetical protein